MNEIKRDIKKLPKWAQNLLAEKDMLIAAQERTAEGFRLAHSVLHEYEGWYTIQGPPASAVDGETYRLFFLSSQGAWPACSLRTGDIMLFGKKRK